MASIFISHASADRAFAMRLSESLTHLGHYVWIDAQQIYVGDLIPKRIAQAIEDCDFLVVVLSKHSEASAWSEHEWYAKYWQEIVSRQTRVLPVVVEECAIPLFLRPKRHADFRFDFAVGLAQLAIVLEEQVATSRADYHINVMQPGSTPLPGKADKLLALSTTPPVCYADESMTSYARLAEAQVNLHIPYIGSITGVWKPDEREQDAAWEMYIELVTRISVAELRPEDGLLRESLSSLYGIFTTTRQILRTYGPSVARPKANSELSFGYLAVSVLNYGLRPVLGKWHPLLLDYEHHRGASVSQFQHELAWDRAEELREALNRARAVLVEYTKLMAQISRVPSIVPN